MLPLLPIITNPSAPKSYKASLSAPTPSPTCVLGATAYSLSYGYSDMMTPPSSTSLSSTSTSTTTTFSSPPPPPPPSPNSSDMLDITPRKCSFSSAFPKKNNACAFPSWPNRPSLLENDTSPTTTNSYLSDEELDFPSSPDEEDMAEPRPRDPPTLTTEEQVQIIQVAVDEEACRERFLAQLHAHARANQNQRMNQYFLAEGRRSAAKSRRPRLAARRRLTSASSGGNRA